MSKLLLLAANSEWGDVSTNSGLSNTHIIVGIIIVLLVLMVFTIFMLAAKRYKRCPSNRVLVIYGKTGHESAKCIHGGAKFIWPLIHDYAWLSLEPMQIEIPLRGALSMENIRVNVPSVFTVAVGTAPDFMQNAAIRLLGLTNLEIKKQAEDMIFGQLRQVIASMQIDDINRDRDKFLENIQKSLEPELRKIGLVLINVNITDITDESGYIEAIGKKAASQAIQKARGDVADNEKMGEIRVADAEREKCVSVANAHKVREIGTREALRDQAVRVAELDKEQKVGEQTASFERESQVKNAEREMRVRVADAEAGAIEGENVAKATIAASQATLQVKKAEAYQTGETRKVQAEAAVLEAEHIARAKAALAEAQRIEAERRAALEAPAKAEKARIEVDAAAEAAKRRIEAEGEASAIFARLEAEARGQYEILAKKGDGLQRIIDACGGSEQAFKMMMLEHFDNLVEASAQAISNIKFDKVVVWEGANQNGTSATANWLHNMARTLPPMMQVLKDVGGVQIPETLADLAEGKPTPDGEPVASAPAVPRSAAGTTK
ncbi:MAG: flotillin family protein [Pirellulales bacterium]|nr:flotillin family protein [Pirellulales bacterium]